MTKRTLKLVLIMSLVIITMLVFNTNKVWAIEINEEKLDEMLNMIPSTMNLDIKEVEYEKSKSIIEKNVEQIFKDNDLDLTSNNIKLNIEASHFRTGFLHHASISLTYNSSRKSKIIDLSYNNTSSHNKNDENYVKGLKFTSPRYYEVDLNFLPVSSTTNNEEWEKCTNNFFDIIGKYYTKQISDSSVVIKAEAGAGGTDGSLNEWTWESGTEIAIFKNGVYYDTRTMGDEFTVPVINVPSSISDDKITDYIISTITNYDKEFGKDITKVTKGAKVKVESKSNPYEIDIPNGYTVEATDRETSYIIVKKEVTTVTNTDTDTNIKLETTSSVVPSTTKLVAEKVSSGENYNTVVTVLGNDVEKFIMYDISLVNENVKIQPNGKVKISLPVPTGYDISKIVVYRISDDGTKTKYDTTIKDGYISFETDHFSNYVVAEETSQETDSTTKTQENNTQKNTTKRELDSTPKTGEETNIISVMTLILGLVTVIGIVVIKKF